MSTRISQLTAAGALTGDEQVEITQLSTTVTITAATISALASDNSFNDSGNGFVTAGFAVGQTVNVTGFTGNVANNIYSAKITALTAGKMTIGGTDGDVLVDDAAGESVTITKWDSKRADYGAGGGGSPITYVIDTGSTADSDPGAGLLKFNNATQSAATELYVDNAAADAADMATFFASLAQTGFVSLVQGDDPTIWRVYKVTAITAMSGYYKFTVVNQAGAGSFADEAEVFVAFDSSAGTNYVPVVIPVAVGDETTDLTTGPAKITFRMATGLALTDVRASVTTAPTGAAIQVDINQNTGGGAVSILSTKLTIDATEKTSTTAAVPPVISNATLTSDAEITIDIDQVGSTIAGAGLKVYLVGVATIADGAVSSVNGAVGAVVLNGGYVGVKWSDIASASTTDIGAANGDFGDITGTTTITALGTISAGVERLVRFTGILTLTHNATSLILPTGANITTAAGDTARFRSLGSGNWVCVSYQRASGASVLNPRAPSIQAVTSSATVTPTFSDDLVTITAQAAALLLANPTGTAIPGLGMVIRIKDNGTARAITYDTQYRAIGITLPTTTVINKTTYLAMIYNSTDTKWDVVATGTEA